MHPGNPVLIRGVADTWRAFREWRRADGGPNLSLFRDAFGDSRVQVAACGEQQFTDQRRVAMSVREFVAQWARATGGPTGGGTGASEGEALYYLKDWHFTHDHPSYASYRTPAFFQDDWLNDHADARSCSCPHCSPAAAAAAPPADADAADSAAAVAATSATGCALEATGQSLQPDDSCCCDDYRFVYMGRAGTWTPLHTDVLRSFSWSVNVCGRKRWLFLSPDQTRYVTHRHTRSTTVYDVDSPVDATLFPEFHKAVWMMVDQRAGDAIFVPSAWPHQVTNMEDTISINHNWINGSNLMHTWRLLEQDEEEAAEAICDVREMVGRGEMTQREFLQLVQRNLKANSGMHFSSLLAFCAFFAARAMRCLLKVAWRREREDQLAPEREAERDEGGELGGGEEGGRGEKKGGGEEVGRGEKKGGGEERRGGLAPLLQARYDLFQIAAVVDCMVCTEWCRHGLWRGDGEGRIQEGREEERRETEIDERMEEGRVENGDEDGMEERDGVDCRSLCGMCKTVCEGLTRRCKYHLSGNESEKEVDFAFSEVLKALLTGLASHDQAGFGLCKCQLPVGCERGLCLKTGEKMARLGPFRLAMFCRIIGEPFEGEMFKRVCY
ncbi:hypothetical protein CLOM_g13074 [Closterium sp. NIES-68]|nr:hypothetical protein CLOM_g13074 [Closterium sp. NIES-68]GJP64759.1 hypothetical protein CLOP_g21711 [Closterium sp. NIES-67]